MYCNNTTNFLFWVLWTCLVTSIKNNNANLQKRWCLSACKQWPPSLTCYFEYSENAWSCPSIMVVSPCKKFRFSWKKKLCKFLSIPIIYHRAKNQKKLTTYSREKRRTDGRTNGQKVRQTDNRDFTGPLVGRGSKM